MKSVILGLAMVLVAVGAGGKPKAKTPVPRPPHIAAPKPPHVSAPKVAHRASMPQKTVAVRHVPKPSHPAKPHPTAIHPGGLNPIGLNGPNFGIMVPGMYHSYHHTNRYHHHWGYRYPRRAVGYSRWNRIGTSPVLQAEMRHLRKIQVDLEAIPRGASPDPSRGRGLGRDLMAAVEGPIRPNQVEVEKLAGDMTMALASRTHPAFDSGRLARDLMEVVNAGSLPPAEVRMASVGASGLLHAAGAGRSEIQSVSADLHAVAFGRGGPLRR